MRKWVHVRACVMPDSIRADVVINLCEGELYEEICRCNRMPVVCMRFLCMAR